VQLQLEGIGGVCSAACNFCPLTDRSYYKNGRQAGTMSMDLFRKIIDEAATIPQIDQLCITGLSETLLDRHLEERIRYARQTLSPRVFIDFYTNGVALTPAKFEAVKRAGVSCVTVSLNANTAEQHDRIMHMGLSAFPKVIANLESAIAHREGVAIQIKAVLDGENFTKRDCVPFYIKWGHREYGGYGQVVVESNWMGENPVSRELDPKKPCDRALGQVYVTWDGIVTLCCLDTLGKGARALTGHPQGLGNLSHQTIREVYNQPVYTQFRVDHDEGRADLYEACRGCTRV
jgi:sulfatase maturation enzyme AslB (radical SAM superfamily)